MDEFKPFQFGKPNTDKKEEDKTAVAIAYEPGEAAPKILATGKGKVAEKIIETAKENKVLYEVVAEILVFVDDMDRMKAKLDHAR